MQSDPGAAEHDDRPDEGEDEFDLKPAAFGRSRRVDRLVVHWSPPGKAAVWGLILNADPRRSFHGAPPIRDAPVAKRQGTSYALPARAPNLWTSASVIQETFRMIETEAHALEGVLTLRPKRFGDERGFFSQTYSVSDMAQIGFDRAFVQDNHSMSGVRGTVRGLHFQAPPRAQDKLLRVVHGAILDVAVDIRIGSPTYGQSVAVELSAENGLQLLVPRGFAHGFQTLTDRAEVLYKVTEEYAPETEGGLLWDDPALGISWPISGEEVTVNARDQGWPSLINLKSPFVFDGHH
jgi:dTDP-4-dehydrorhamnose 3,5-epimerase